MKKQLTSAAKDNLRAASDAVSCEGVSLTNLLVLSRFAALWQKEHDNGQDDGICWSMVLEGPVTEAAMSLAVKTSDLKEMAISLAHFGNAPEIKESYTSLAREVSKLQTALIMFGKTAIDEDESGHDKAVDWPDVFEILLDIAQSIEKMNEDLYYKVHNMPSPYAPLLTGQGVKTASTQHA